MHDTPNVFSRGSMYSNSPKKVSTCFVVRLGTCTLRNKITEKSWDLPRYKSKGGPATNALSADQIAELQQDRHKEPSPADDSIISLKSLETELKVGPEAIRQALADANVTTENYKFRNVTALGVKRDMVEAVRLALLPPIPDGWSDIQTLAADLAITSTTIRNVAVAEGWKLPTYRGIHKPVKTLNPSQIQHLKNKYGK